MPESLRRRQAENPTPPTPAEQACPPEIPEVPAPPASVQVIFGPMADRMDVQGMTVGEAYGLLRHTLNLPDGNVTALVNGEESNGDRRLQAGETLEFVRIAGEKGGRAV